MEQLVNVLMNDDNSTEPEIVPIEEPTPPVGPPVTPPQPYVYVNYVLAGMECLIMLLSAFLFVRSMRAKRSFDKQKLLFVHCFAWALSRVVLSLLPRQIYVSTIKNPPLQTFLDIIPEALFQMTFVVLNSMWIVIYLQMKAIDPRKAARIFWGFYFFVTAALIIGCGIMVLMVHVKKSDSFATTPFWERYTTWEVLFYSSTACFTLVASVVCGFGILRYMQGVHSSLTRDLASKLGKIRVMVFVTFAGTALKTIYKLAMQGWVQSLYAQNIVDRVGWAVIWFFYFFIGEIAPIGICLVLFLFKSKQKTVVKISGEEYLIESLLHNTGSSQTSSTRY